MGREIAGVILAAGEGRRLQPYTNAIPKPLMTIGGKFLLTYHIERLRNMGINDNDICVVVRYLAEEVIGAIKSYHPNVKCVRQEEEKSGTAMGVLAAKNFVGKRDVIIIFGDTYFDDPLDHWVECEEPLIGVAHVEDVSKFGRVISDDKGFLLDIEEKPATNEGGVVFAGALKEQHGFLDIIPRLPESRDEYRLTDVILLQNNTTPHRIHRLNGYWNDIGTDEALREARKHYNSSRQ